MPLLKSCLCLCLLTLACAAGAASLMPFSAEYDVWLNGKRQGVSEVRLERLDADRWRYTLDTRATEGAARLTGFEMRQTTEFTVEAQRLRLQRSSSERSVLLRSKREELRFDWQRQEASWSGDVKEDQRGPLPIGTDSYNGQLLNLALALDVARDGETAQLDYAVFERGRRRDMRYRLGAPETVEVPLGRFHAVPARYTRAEKQREQTAWIATEYPLIPVRILQREEGQDKYELRLRKVDLAPR